MSTKSKRRLAGFATVCFTQLTGLAFGFTPSEFGLSRNVIPTKSLTAEPAPA